MKITLKPEVAALLKEAAAHVAGGKPCPQYLAEDMPWLANALIRAGAEAILRQGSIPFPLQVVLTHKPR